MLKRALLIFAVVIIFTSIFLSYNSKISRAIRTGHQITGVIIGTDWVDHSIHSDTIMFFCYDPYEKILDVISIPRDTKINIPEMRFHRINEVYAYHYKKTKNPNLAAQELITAVDGLFNNRLNTQYYVRINYDLFSRFINTIGGVDIDIDEPMNYDDNAGKLHIHFTSGTHHLDGKKSLEFVRFRSTAGDIGRIYRQQRFLRAVMTKFINPLNVVRLPLILNLVVQEINTNLSLWDILNLSLEIKHVNLKNIRMAQLPGKPRGMLWEKDDRELDRIINLITITPLTDSTTSSTVLDKNTGPIRVQVFNASSKSGTAVQVTDKLRKEGYDVFDWGNYAARIKKSQVIDRVGNLSAAQKIAKILDIHEVITRYDSKLMVDLTVVLGEDYFKGD
jgi:LCP family protein required for cell wall assembly